MQPDQERLAIRQAEHITLGLIALAVLKGECHPLTLNLHMLPLQASHFRETATRIQQDHE
jgi:hypothetical protein